MTESPLLEWMASGEEAELSVAAFARFRATYQGEGYYDDRSHGDPSEQDLYQIDILDASAESRDGWDVDEWGEEQFEDLGLHAPSYHLLLPAVRTGDEEDAVDELRYAKQYLLVLAYRLYTEPPEYRAQIPEESTCWTIDLLEEAYDGLPAEWQVLGVEGEQD
jgi:hypothetical protein